MQFIECKLNSHLNIIEIILLLLRLLVVSPQSQIVDLRTFAQVHALEFCIAKRKEKRPRPVVK